jgi:hypothetical protein
MSAKARGGRSTIGPEVEEREQGYGHLKQSRPGKEQSEKRECAGRQGRAQELLGGEERCRNTARYEQGCEVLREGKRDLPTPGSPDDPPVNQR